MICLKSKTAKKLVVGISAFCLVTLIALGAMAKNNWLPSTDPMTGEKTGWFGTKLPKNASSSWNPLAAPPPPPTPQLSKEYVYAGSGSRLLAVEDANANAAPPSDLAVWRPTNGTWYVNKGTTWMQQAWGQAGDTPIPGDFDGDGKTDFSIFRPGTPYATWYIIHSSTGGQVSFQYAVSSDLPAQADYDGDGKTDPAVYRPPTGGATNGVWYIQGTTAGYYTYTWGEAGDIPASADYDGDGRADIGVFRLSNRTFYSIHSSNNNIVNYASGIPSGTYDWQTVSGDYDGDGRGDYAVYNKTTATWYVRQSSTGTFNAPFTWGTGGDFAVHNDYDGDGKVDYAVWTPSGANVGRWHIKKSSDNSTRDQTWGIQYDIPVPAFYRR